MKDLEYEEQGPPVFSMKDMVRLRRMCIDEHRWPGCEADPEFTNQGQSVQARGFWLLPEASHDEVW
jgi:hypothetical protein